MLARTIHTSLKGNVSSYGPYSQDPRTGSQDTRIGWDPIFPGFQNTRMSWDPKSPGSWDHKYLEDHYFQLPGTPNIWRTTIPRSTRSQNWRISNVSRFPRNQNWQISNIPIFPSNQNWQISNFDIFSIYFIGFLKKKTIF